MMRTAAARMALSVSMVLAVAFASSVEHRQHHDLNARDSLLLESISRLHVLPPSPDDSPEECPVNATLFDSCGEERYCALLPFGSDSAMDHRHPEAPPLLALGLKEGSNATGTAESSPNYYYCLHKTLWSSSDLLPLSARDAVAFLLAATCCFLAAMAGIGGGGLVLPILLLCCNFTPKEASVLSNTAVFCNTLGQFAINNHHDNNNHSKSHAQSVVVVLATVLIMMPSVIAGGSIAITLEGMVPSTVILILAFLTLLLAAIKTYHKAQTMRRAEQQAKTTIYTDYSSDQRVGTLVEADSNGTDKEEERTPQQDGTSSIQCKLQLLIGTFWLLDAIHCLFLHTMRIPLCSPLYILLVAFPALVAVLFVGLGRCLVQSLGRRQDPPSGERLPLIQAASSNPGYHQGGPEEHHQDKFQSLLAWWLPWASVLIGLLAALLGIGGGELLGPILLLLLQMDAQQSSATTAIMSMMNSGTNLFHYLVMDMMIAPDYAITLGLAGLVGGSGGRLWAIHVAQRGRPSIIAWSLCAVLALGTALVAWELVTTPLSFQSKGGIC
ncbi:Sulfite exporter TauE/SafE [Seminavis robusta]|uniref:Sulfite exporter TauE/SafE n=1 Tax=Seminavis robusta TaxID=568900 RepID=A0A9N8HTP9_9STRA|nr:Sulfite exporter TauE/SafE [Seminavis robusta]|eukprot:Sro1540_g280860.1 Sulfite exporter TauE/SafE (554) ;mRNA; f:10452-12113